jgi:predicted DNA-binding WGR domain protein
LGNPRCPSDILDKIFAAAFDEWQLDPEDIGNELAMMASHPNASQELLQKLSDLDDPLVMEQLAGNANCDAGLRQHIFAKLEETKQIVKIARTQKQAQPKDKKATSAKKEPVVKAGSIPEPSKKRATPAKQEKPVSERQATTPSDSVFRRFEFADEKSSKFWSIRLSGMEVEVKYGRIGSEGQSQNKTFETLEAAHKHAEKLIAEKTSKGYHETT